MCNFICLGKECPNHCCGPYNGISPNLRSLSGVQMSEIILLPKDIDRIKNAGLSHLIQIKGNGVHTISTASDGTCIALKDGRCSIYDFRPAICRAYPLYLDMFSGVCVLTECPVVPKDIHLDDHSDALENLLDIYQYWINFYRKQP